MQSSLLLVVLLSLSLSISIIVVIIIIISCSASSGRSGNISNTHSQVPNNPIQTRNGQKESSGRWPGTNAFTGGVRVVLP